jgi:histidinol phosphate phosphatase hisN-like protein
MTGRRRVRADRRGDALDLREPRTTGAGAVAGPGARLVRSGVCGRGGPGAAELDHLATRLVAGDRAVLGDLPPFSGLTRERVDDVRRLVWGETLVPPTIDPHRTLAAAAAAAAQLAHVASARRTVVFATAMPASLLPLQQHLARLARAGGAQVVDAPDSAPLRADGRAARCLRVFGGVAAVTDGASVLATRDVGAARHWARSLGRPSLAVTDGPFALAAIALGVPTIAFADLRNLAVALAAGDGAPVTAVPVRVGRPPRAYEALGDVVDAAFAAALSAGPSSPTKATSRIGS